MDEITKASIKARKDVFFNTYEINDDEILKKIDNLFEKINQFACEHNLNFEADFLNSDLNQEYIDLFTFISTKCKPKTYEMTNNVNGELIKEELESELRYQEKELTRPIRRKVREDVRSTAYNIPIIGDAMTVKQHFDLFNKFKKKK